MVRGCGRELGLGQEGYYYRFSEVQDWTWMNDRTNPESICSLEFLCGNQSTPAQRLCSTCLRRLGFIW